MPASELLPEAFEITLTYFLAAYDACYVELSQRLGAPLITCDERLVRALSHAPYDVRLLKDIQTLIA